MKQLNDSTLNFNEKLESQKSELGMDLEGKMKQALEEKERYEAKYNEKRQAFRDLEKNTTSSIQSLEREKAVLEEKLNSLESKNSEVVNQKDHEIAKLKDKIADSKLKMTDSESVLHEEVNNYKA